MTEVEDQALVRVQVVEDDPLTGADLVACLRRLGYDAPPPAVDVASALVAVEREQPQVVVLDIKLASRGDGVELARMLRERSEELALVFLTGCTDRETIDRAVQMSPAGYLIKPFSEDGLYAALETAIKTLRVGSSSCPGVIAHGARLKRVLTFIEENLDRNLSLDELAREAGLSKDHFGRLFRQTLGLGPHRYLVQRRIAMARRLLETTDTPILEIALAVGYDSQTYFTTAFRKECGRAPASYRRQHRSG